MPMKSLGDFLYGKSHFKHCQNACPLVVTYLVEGSSFLLSFFHFLSSFQEGKTAKKRIPKKVVRHKSPPSCLMRQEGIPPTLSCYKLFAFNMKVNIIFILLKSSHSDNFDCDIVMEQVKLWLIYY